MTKKLTGCGNIDFSVGFPSCEAGSSRTLDDVYKFRVHSIEHNPLSLAERPCRIELRNFFSHTMHAHVTEKRFHEVMSTDPDKEYSYDEALVLLQLKTPDVP